MKRATIVIDVYDEYFNIEGFLTNLGKEILEELGNWVSITFDTKDEVRLPK